MAMNKVLVTEKLGALLREQLLVALGDLTLNAKLVDDLGADSLDVVELITEIEDEFGIVISEDEAEKLVTVGDVIDFVAEKAIGA